MTDHQAIDDAYLQEIVFAAVCREKPMVPRGVLTPEMTFAELGVTSMGALAISYDLEEVLGTRFPDDNDLYWVTTLGELIERLKKYVPGKEEA
jgi:acyl carrier protein